MSSLHYRHGDGSGGVVHRGWWRLQGSASPWSMHSIATHGALHDRDDDPIGFVMGFYLHKFRPVHSPRYRRLA